MAEAIVTAIAQPPFRLTQPLWLSQAAVICKLVLCACGKELFTLRSQCTQHQPSLRLQITSPYRTQYGVAENRHVFARLATLSQGASHRRMVFYLLKGLSPLFLNENLRHNNASLRQHSILICKIRCFYVLTLSFILLYFT